MEDDRLFKLNLFKKPEWLNTLWARNIGVYSAGALVRSPAVVSLHLPGRP
jgi:hypothetical protein